MAMFRKIKMTIPIALTMPTIGSLISGEPNPFYPLVLVANDNTPKNQIPDTSGKSLDRYSLDGETYVYHTIFDLNVFTLQLVGLILQQGGEVESYPTFAKIDIESSPPGFEGTWQELAAATNKEITQIGEDHYVPTTILGGQDYLPMTQAAFLFGFENLINEHTFVEIRNAAQAQQDQQDQEEPE
jgi:hypothetical protein